MGFLIFLAAAASPLCTTNYHGKLIVFPCLKINVVPQEPLPVRCRGDRFDRSMSFSAVTGYCPQRTIA